MHFVDFDLKELIQAVGYVGIFFIVFAESGLFFGFFFPGDSLLFTAGFLASQDILDIKILLPLVVIAAIGGDSAGYWTGNKLGRWLMERRESFIFKKKYITKANKFYEEHGGKALVMARFIPAVRTFVPIVAGMAEMHYKKFLTYNMLGGFLWGAGMLLAGYYLGTLIPGVDKYLLPIIAIIIILSVLPGVWHMRDEIRTHASRRTLFFAGLKIKTFTKKHPLLAKLYKLKEDWLG